MGSSLSIRRAARPSSIHFPSSPAYLSTKRHHGDTLSQTTLRELIESKCPAVLSDFKPAWWLFNGDLQTLYCVVGDFSSVDRVIYSRTYLRLKDGGTLGLDFTLPGDDSAIDESPIIVVLHGLTGGSYESYVRAVLAPACTPVKQGGLGYRGVVVNFRGCSKLDFIVSAGPQLYSAGHTEDIRQALLYISHLYPKAPLVGVGFSLGANVLTRYLAEEGTRSRLVAGCALACPWDLKKNSDHLRRTVVGRHVYSRGMGTNLLNLFKRHIAALSTNPTAPIVGTIPIVLALKRPRLRDFDQNVTRLVGGSSPPFPFDSADDYYYWASSHRLIAQVKVPFLSINSADDPIVQEVPMDAGGNGMTVMVVTPAGGHLGWFESTSLTHVQRWVTKPVLQWCRAVAEDIETVTYRKPLYVDDDGFLTEEGRVDQGCKVVDNIGENIIVGTQGEGNILQGL